MSAKSVTTENKPGTSRNEQVIRSLYQAADVPDSKKFTLMFTADGVFNMSKVLNVVVTVSAACLWVVMAHSAMADHGKD
jgi:hypothetical protein